MFVPKYRRRVLYRDLREYLGDIFHDLARQCESRIEEGHLCPDHVHMMISIPPKKSVSDVVGKASKLRWRELLGPRLPRVYRWKR